MGHASSGHLPVTVVGARSQGNHFRLSDCVISLKSLEFVFKSIYAHYHFAYHGHLNNFESGIGEIYDPIRKTSLDHHGK